MRGNWAILVLLGWTSGEAWAVQTPLVERTLTVSDGIFTKDLTFGLDPCATDGLDACVGEAGLPPFPPLGAFDVRWIGYDIGIDLDLGSFTDVRFGDDQTPAGVLHELSLQLGLGTEWTLSWNLPNGTTGLLTDPFGGVVLSEMLFGQGSLKITNTALNRLFLFAAYGPPYPLFSPTLEVSLASGGIQALTLEAGAAHAGDPYLLLGSVSGTTPGTPVGGTVLPLNWDGYSFATLTLANQAPFLGTFGLLDASGSAKAHLDLPAGMDPFLAGVTIQHAFLASGAAGVFASNPLPLTLVP